MLEDTIAAIATPLGEGGLSVIRVSGPQSLAVVDRCFVPHGSRSQKPSAAASHTIHYGHIERDGRVLDEVLVSVLRAPRTFTREDTVEISCHGGLLTTKLVLAAVLASGARVAGPGEFTRRAFLNGRLDLTQAEAVADVIHSRTELALAAANEQLAGHLSRRIDALRDGLMKTLAHIEAHIDFPDDDISPDTHVQLVARLQEGVRFMDDLLRTADEGRILRRGLRAAIVGRPNAGKSSLLNRLLGQDRAIVSPVPGTTRDTIEETANIRGIPIVFIDTAGLRETGDAIEQEGVRRSRESLAQAELILHVLDAADACLEPDSSTLSDLSGKKVIVVCNKADLPRKLSVPPTAHRVVDVSCATGAGLETLKDAIEEVVWAGANRGGMAQATINARHQDALRRARVSTATAMEGLQAGLSLELIAIDLHVAVNAVGEIVGKTTTEDLLDAIFSQFCLGK